MAKDKSGTTHKYSNQNRNPADFFLVKFYDQILNSSDCNHICNWAEDGLCMVVYDPQALIRELKARHVSKQNDYMSFARQMRIYRWYRVRKDEMDQTPWPDTAKAWRHPTLHRDSTEDEIAIAVREAPSKTSAQSRKGSMSQPRQQSSLSVDGDRDLPVPSLPPIASTSTAHLDPLLDPALRGVAQAQVNDRPTQLQHQQPALQQRALNPAGRPPQEHRRALGRPPIGSAVPRRAVGAMPNKGKGVGFYEDDMLFGGVEEDGSDDDQALSRSPESRAMRALRIEMQGARRTGPRAPVASDHLARIDLSKAGSQDLALPPIPPMSMALEDFPEELYYNSNMVMEHAATNPMNFDHPWAALSQISKLKGPSRSANAVQARPDISVPVLS